MKKLLALGIAVLLFLVSLTGCDEENGELNYQNNINDNSPAIINSTPNNILPLKTYVAPYVMEGDDEVSSTLILHNDNKFTLFGNKFISYAPSGTYTIDNEKLLLTVTEDEVYVFNIDDDKLIFNSGTWLENWVEQGTVFHLKYENNNTNIIFNTADVEKLEVFAVSVPAQAMRKTVTNENDIKGIIDGLNALTIVREATNDDFLAGGIGLTFHFHLKNGHNYTINNTDNLLRNTDGLFVVSGTSIGTDTFWNSLNYEAVLVGESGLPMITDRNQNKNPILTFDWKNVNVINVSHFQSGKITEWAITDKQEIEDLADWFNALSIFKAKFAEGESPGDLNGGEVYSFSFGNEFAFSYGIYGSHENYIITDEWHFVKNPSNPFSE